VLIFNAFIKTFLAEFHVKIYGLLYEDIESNKDTHDYRVFRGTEGAGLAEAYS
jgi:hypothetical protein